MSRRRKARLLFAVKYVVNRCEGTGVRVLGESMTAIPVPLRILREVLQKQRFSNEYGLKNRGIPREVKRALSSSEAVDHQPIRACSYKNTQETQLFRSHEGDSF